MITTFKNTNQTINAVGSKHDDNVRADIIALPVARPVKHIGKSALDQRDAEARPANHNLTRAALRSNVVVLGRATTTDDFPPDMGARPALVA